MCFSKSFFVSLCFLFAVHNSVAQCTANAGAGTTLCVSWQGLDSFSLGGEPVVNGGVPPFTYSWETSWSIGQLNFTASDFLDDTTAANPFLISVNEEPLTFFLTVTDATNNSCFDTVTVGFSVFNTHLGTFSFEIDQGDTVSWPEGNVGGGIPPLEYLWTPNLGLIDSIGQGFVASPNTSVVYGITVTDSIGCVVEGSPFVYVTVLPVSVKELDHSTFQAYPNPAYEQVLFNFEEKESFFKSIKLIDGKGCCVKQLTTDNTEVSFDVSDLPAGVYVYSITSPGRQIKQGRLVIER